MYQTRREVIEKLLNTTDSSETSTGILSCTSSSNASAEGSRSRSSVLRQREWTDVDQFIEDNLREVYEKLPNLEKQIWGKLIVMEGNRRTAKAYLRHPLITIDGSDVEFDGLRIGLSRFDNSSRSSVVYEIFNDILAGVKVKIDPDGNVWAKRTCSSPVYLKPLYRNGANDLYMIDQRPAKVFDIRRFKRALVEELKQKRPNRRTLERCCLLCMKFSYEHPHLLKTPCWVIIVHLVAIELLNLVLPKDYEFSSPSSSFTAASPSFQPDSVGISKPWKNLDQGLSRRLYTKHGRESSKCGPLEKEHDVWSAGMSDCQSWWPSGGMAGSRSMVDLRNGLGLGQSAVPMIPRRPHMGINACHRITSMETVNGPHSYTPEYTPEPKSLIGHMERMHLHRWRSQDSGIASGSGSYGRK